MLNIRKRVEESANYSAIFIDGKTLRIPLDAEKPITELEYPEFLDVTFGDKCKTGKCSYCYANGNPNGRHFPNIVKKINTIFGAMTQNQRPFQVAVGGSQEPLENPEFWDAVLAFKNLNIVPNYTTNGVLFSQKIADKTKEICGGVAITCHLHLEKFWQRALEIAIKNQIKTNIHVIISDLNSINKLKEVYSEYNGKIDYFVLLPYMNVGAAMNQPKNIEYQELEKWLDTIQEFGNIAFGANFYQFLKPLKKWDISLYPPEILSKYLVLDDPIALYKSSFDTSTPLKRNWIVN